MTKPHYTRRQRPGAVIPPHVAAWFAGERTEQPWEALVPGYEPQMRGWWADWCKAHPGATRPANWGEWLDADD